MIDISPYLHVQNIALRVLRDIVPFIKVGNTEDQVAGECTRLLEQHGARDSWYHNIPALVLVGERTTLSVSGRVYQPSKVVTIRTEDLVTIDLSPSVDGFWGDCARSYIVASGEVATSGKTAALDYGLRAERALHALMKEFVTPETSMDKLYNYINQAIEDLGYRNLDFRGNLGHSIERHTDDRRYIEAGNQDRLGDCKLFTFEPHICRTDDAWGFKLENIYYFKDGNAVPLGSPQLLEPAA